MTVLPVLQEMCDGEEECIRANERFFRRLTRNARLGEAMQRFKEETGVEGDFTIISLDNISSRARTLPFGELTAHGQREELNIPFSFHSREFLLDFEIAPQFQKMVMEETESRFLKSVQSNRKKKRYNCKNFIESPNCVRRSFNFLVT